MSQVFTQGGLFNIVQGLWLPTTTGLLHVGLFKNNFSPNYLTILANLTQSTFPGYVLQALGAAATIATVGDQVQATYPALTFTCTSATPVEFVYGYFVEKLPAPPSQRLFIAARDPTGPWPIQNPGDSYEVDLRVSFQSLFDM